MIYLILLLLSSVAVAFECDSAESFFNIMRSSLELMKRDESGDGMMNFVKKYIAIDQITAKMVQAVRTSFRHGRLTPKDIERITKDLNVAMSTSMSKLLKTADADDIKFVSSKKALGGTTIITIQLNTYGAMRNIDLIIVPKSESEYGYLISNISVIKELSMVSICIEDVKKIARSSLSVHDLIKALGEYDSSI